MFNFFHCFNFHPYLFCHITVEFIIIFIVFSDNFWFHEHFYSAIFYSNLREKNLTESSFPKNSKKVKIIQWFAIFHKLFLVRDLLNLENIERSIFCDNYILWFVLEIVFPWIVFSSISSSSDLTLPNLILSILFITQSLPFLFFIIFFIYRFSSFIILCVSKFE